MFFRDRYWFLSNMYPCAVTVPWGTYKCAETAFHAAKCVNSEDMLQFQNMEGGLENAGRIKRAGRTVVTDLDSWNRYRVPIMEIVVKAKFKDPVLAAKLVEIEEEIVEDTVSWTDKFWGRTNGIGENNLGKILQKVKEEITMDKNQNLNNDNSGNKEEEKTMRRITIVSGALNPLDTNRNFRNTYVNADPDIKMPNTGVIIVAYSVTNVMNAIKNNGQVVTVRVNPDNVAALSRALLTAGFEVNVPSSKGTAAEKKDETKKEPDIFSRTFGTHTIPRTAVVNKYSLGVVEKGDGFVMVKPLLVITPVTPVCESALTGCETWDLNKINGAVRCCGAFAINGQHVGVFSVVVDDATARDIIPNFSFRTLKHPKVVVAKIVKKILLQEKKIDEQDDIKCWICDMGHWDKRHIEGNKEGSYFYVTTFCAETQNQVKKMYREFCEEHATVYHLGTMSRSEELEQLKADIKAKDAEIVALRAELAAAQNTTIGVKQSKKARRMPSVFNGLNIQALIDKNLSVADVAAMVVEIKQARYDLIAAADGTKAKKAGIPRSFLGCSVTSAIKRGLSFAAFIEEVKAFYLGEQDQQDEQGEQNEQDKPTVPGDITADTEVEDGGEEPAVEATDDPQSDINKDNKDNDDPEDPEDPQDDNTPDDDTAPKKDNKPKFSAKGFCFASSKEAVEIVNGKQNDKADDEDDQEEEQEDQGDQEEEQEELIPEEEKTPDVQDKGDIVSTTPKVVLAVYEDPDDETWEKWYKVYGSEKFVKKYYEVEVKRPNALQSEQEVNEINKEIFEQAQTNLCCLAGFFFDTDKDAFVKGLSEICDNLGCDVYIKDVIVDNDGNVFVTLPVSMGSDTVTVRLEKHDDKLVSFQE